MTDSKLKKDLLYKIVPSKEDLLVIPISLRDKLLYHFHNTILSVHTSRDRMLKIMQDRFYWPGITTDISRWVSGCLTCSKIKPTQPLINGLLVPIATSAPFEIVGMDILGPFKVSKDGYKYVLVCIDLFTSWVEAAPLKTLKAEETLQVFFR